MSTPTPRTDAAVRLTFAAGHKTVCPNFARTLERELYAVEATLASERGDHLRELAAERQKVRALTAILESICEEWGRNYNTNPIGAGQRMETLASKMLEKLEDEA